MCPRLGKLPAIGYIEFEAQLSHHHNERVIVHDTKNKITESYSPHSPITIHKDGVHESPNPAYNVKYSSNDNFKRRAELLYEELNFKEYPADISLQLFLMNDEQAAHALKNDLSTNLLIHLSPNNFYQVTYRDGNNIKHIECYSLDEVDHYLQEGGLEDNTPLANSQHARFNLFSRMSGSSMDLNLSSEGKRLRSNSDSDDGSHTLK